jgi:hypothetical protein
MRSILILLAGIALFVAAGCSTMEDIDQEQAQNVLEQVWDAVQDYLGDSGD